MSFDDCPSQAEAEWRETLAANQAIYWEELRIEVEHREASECPEAARAHWEDGAFQAYPEHMKRLHWPSRSLDRRLHDRDAAVADGEIRDDVAADVPFDAGSAA